MPNNASRTSPLRVQFVVTSLPVGGAETLLLNLVKGMDRRHFFPEVVCLKEPGELGQAFASEAPLVSDFWRSKWDPTILQRLRRHFIQQRADAVITVAAGDKMFWGRLAAWTARCPVICSALHSTGWPDGVGRLNRALNPITDGFIAVANQHAAYMIENEAFPQNRVVVIPNGVDTNRFRPNHTCRQSVRSELALPRDSQIVTIVAALREEKNHGQFLKAAAKVQQDIPSAQFLVVGDGPERGVIEREIKELGLTDRVHLLGCRSDTERILAASDVFVLTSKNEANPVSILEALACGIPAVAPKVGSIEETVQDERTGLLTPPLCAASTARAITQLLIEPDTAQAYGLAGRELVRHQWSVTAMIQGYERLVECIYNTKMAAAGRPLFTRAAPNLSASGASANSTKNAALQHATQLPHEPTVVIPDLAQAGLEGSAVRL